jgi:hypothetical protein
VTFPVTMVAAVTWVPPVGAVNQPFNV